ncbi:hypothetical protein ACOBQB_32640 [Streptomyces sp. G5(2025)]|uniref:hypothetical protein n=1 Tax=Streptomyces sp. G5(2025) TaxID=3406628 RepID=UPI003C14A9F3
MALVLGGLLVLLVLGFLFGERAQAAEGVPSRPLERVQSARAAEPVPVAQRAESRPGAAADPVATPVPQAAAPRHIAEPVVGPGAGAVPVGKPEVPRAELPVDKAVDDAVDVAVDDVTDALRRTPPPARWIPEPGLPGSGDGEGPGRDADPAPAPGAMPTPMPTPTPVPGTAAEGGARGEDGSVSGREHLAERSAGPRAESPHAAGGGLPGHRVGAHSGAGKAVAENGAGQAPLPAPAAPGGSLGNATAVDGNASRHGDPHAAALDSRAPVRLLAGPGCPADSAPLRDRHRDVPEFPG